MDDDDEWMPTKLEKQVSLIQNLPKTFGMVYCWMDYINDKGLKPEHTLVYACGHPGMIEDLKYRCLPLGFKIDEERFWKDD